MPASEAGPSGRLDRWSRAFWFPIACGLIHSILVVVAFPPFGIWACTFVSPLPLLAAAISQHDRPFRAGLLAAVGVLPLHLYEHHWIIDVSGFGFIPMAMILAGFGGLFVWILGRCVQRLTWLPLTLAVPVVWVGVEVFRGEVFFSGYPWLLLAHPLVEWPVLAMPASLIGTYGVSFLLAVLSGAVSDLVKRHRKPAIAGIAAIPVVYGLAAALHPGAGEAIPFRIAVIQTNLAQDNKNEWTKDQRVRDFARFEVLTRQAAAVTPPPDLIPWPETMFPGNFLDPLHTFDNNGNTVEVESNFFQQPLLDLQRGVKVPLLIGALGADNLRLNPEGRYAWSFLYNSVFLLRDGRIEKDRYDKMELTPFGEVMPYIHYWPWLQQKMLDFAARGMAFDLSAGLRPVLFRAPTRDGKHEAVIATPICFEATKPALCRRLLQAAGESPAVLINLTNDGWFGKFDAGRWQHLQIARWRAVELNTPVVRAANTGVSAAIDARGRLLKAGVDGSPPLPRAQVDGVLTADILLGGPRTIYARTGDVLGWTALGAACALLVASFRRPVKEAA